MRGLLCIEPLYHAIVDGRKTQTRRSGGLDVINDTSIQMNGHQRGPDDWEIESLIMYGQEFTKEQLSNKMGVKGDVHGLEYKFTNKSGFTVICKPRYKVGEVLYLKEPTRKLKGSNYIEYLFDYATDHYARKNVKWFNKLFMPASAARAFVRITGIRCERLLDISHKDCIAEGIEKIADNDGGVLWKHYEVKPKYETGYFNNPKKSFLSLYKLANKVKEVPNLFVWVYEFEYLKNYEPHRP